MHHKQILKQANKLNINPIYQENKQISNRITVILCYYFILQYYIASTKQALVMKSIESMKSNSNLLRDREIEQVELNDQQFPNQTIELNITNTGILALPPPLPFEYELLPTMLLQIFRQIQVLYFLGVGMLLFFRYCERETGVLIAHLGFLIGYIMIQMAARHLTFKSFKSITDTDQQYSQLVAQGWRLIRYQDIKVGQIIKIVKGTLVPVNLLPIATSSHQKHIFIDTYSIYKQQHLTKVTIIEQLANQLSNNHQHLQYFKWTIKYTFSSSMGQIFQAFINFHNKQKNPVQITNKDTIPRGTKLQDEDYIIGIVLYSLEKSQKQQIKSILRTSNSIDDILTKHLKIVIIVMLVISPSILFLATALIYSINQNQVYNELGCYFLNTLALLSQSVHVTMYLYYSLRRLIDAISLGRNSRVIVKNYIKSIDQFGIVDAIVTDDYFFLKRRLLKVGDIIRNSEYNGSLQMEDIFQIIQKSQQMRMQFPDQWLALYKRKKQNFSQSNIEIGASQKVDKCFGLGVKINRNHYFINFTEKPRISKFSDIKEENLRYNFLKTVKKSQDNEGLIFLVTVTDILDYQIGQNLIGNEDQERVHCIITFQYTYQQQPVYFINKLKSQYNFVFMTSKSWDQMEGIMIDAKLKTKQDTAIIFQDQGLKEFKQQIIYRVKKLPEQQKIERQKILCFDSSLVSHLSQNQVRNNLKKLAKVCRYLIFYNCTQYQKEICASSIFKIFPRHLYFTNFQCDANICKISNISACLSIAPSAPYTTVQVLSYKTLQTLLSKNAAHSIRVTLQILYSHIFKNQLLISSSLTAMFVIYRGNNFYTGVEYSQYLFILYNLFFSIVPELFYVIKRPKSYRMKKAPKYETRQLIFEHLKGIIMGIVLTLIAYAFISEQFVSNLFMSILIFCIITSNFYHLIIDRSLNKFLQLFIILIQCLLTIGLLFLLALLDSYFGDKIIQIQLNLGPSNVYFYIVSFLICPIISISTLYIFALIGSIDAYNCDIAVEVGNDPYLGYSEAGGIAEIQKSSGKQMKFKYTNLNQNK